MPRNLQADLNTARQRTDQYISGLGDFSDTSSQGIRSNVGNRYSQFLGNTLGTSPGINMSPATISHGATPLQRELNRGLAQKKLTDRRNQLDLGYQTVDRRNTEAQNNLNSSLDYSRQNQLTTNQQQYLAEQQQAQIAALTQRQDLADKYANQGVALQNQYLPDMSYNAALYRSLFGTATQLGTAYVAYGNQPSYNTYGQTQPVNRTAGTGVNYDPYAQYYGKPTAGVNGYGGNY